MIPRKGGSQNVRYGNKKRARLSPRGTFEGRIGDLAEATAQSVDEIDGILHEKQDINSKVAFTIPTTGWGTDSSVPQHPKFIDITVSGLLETDIVAVDVAPGSSEIARAANFTNTQSYAGKFRLRAASVPTAAISAQYHIINTVKYTD